MTAGVHMFLGATVEMFALRVAGGAVGVGFGGAVSRIAGLP